MALQPRQPSRPDVRIATRLSLPPLVAGIALAVFAIVPPAAAKPDRSRDCGQLSVLTHVTPDVRVTVGTIRGIQFLDTPCGTARNVALRCFDGRVTEGWSCIADPNPRVLLRLRGVGLPPGQARLVTVLMR
jgi:hypothetical protein